MRIILQQHLDDDLAEFLRIPYVEQIHIGFLTPKLAAARLLSRDLLRKQEGLRGERQKLQSISKWREMNERCKKPFNCFSHREEVQLILGNARNLLEQIIPWDATQPEVFSVKPEDGRFGPGASIGASDNSFFSKTEASPLTYTHPKLISFYLEAASVTPTFHECERLRRERHGYVMVQGSRLTTVPKDDKTDRAICIEPSLNMFAQQAVRARLERILKSRCNIDLADQQDIQRDMARKGSVTGKFCTVDLSSASDTISLSFARWLLPPRLFDILETVRAPFCEVEGEWTEVHMISSMGNATTFPLETLIFWALTRSVMHSMNIKCVAWGEGRNIGVFGDDIIAPNQCFGLLCEVLCAAGFIPNVQKSFHIGQFRESCGGDFLHGVQVTPVRLKGDLSLRTELFSAINRLIVWSTEHGIILRRTIPYLMSKVRKPLFVPSYEPVNSGIWANFSHSRWYKVLRPLGFRIQCEPEPSLHTVLSGSVYSYEDGVYYDHKPFSVCYVSRKALAVAIPSKPYHLAISPDAVVDLLTVPRQKWICYTTFYGIPNQ